MIDFKEPEAFRTYYCLSRSEPERIEFVTPRMRLIFIGATALIIGLLVLLYPELFNKQPKTLIPIVGWSGVLIAISISYLVLTRKGTLILDKATRKVRLEFSSPKEQIVWVKPFSEFSMVKTSQVKDMHGLHNHWKIELVIDNIKLKVGYGLMGAIGKKSRDKLVSQLSEMLDIPVVHQKRN